MPEENGPLYFITHQVFVSVDVVDQSEHLLCRLTPNFALSAVFLLHLQIAQRQDRGGADTASDCTGEQPGGGHPFLVALPNPSLQLLTERQWGDPSQG